MLFVKPYLLKKQHDNSSGHSRVLSHEEENHELRKADGNRGSKYDYFDDEAEQVTNHILIL
jgi:hypothetical protein